MPSSTKNSISTWIRPRKSTSTAGWIRPARAAALRKLGNTTQIREEVYGMNTLTFIEGLLRDAPCSADDSTKPGFSVAALLSLALGMARIPRFLAS